MKEKTNPAVQQQLERGVRIYETSNSADTELSKEGGWGDAGAGIPQQPVVKTLLKHRSLCNPWSSHRICSL